jgi:hypothetical protein
MWAGSTALALLLILVVGTAVLAQGTGTLEGTVVNGTPDGPEVGAGITIFLHVQLGQEELDVLETATGADGTFAFKGLDTRAELEYWPEAVYLDVAYIVDEPYRFGEGETALDATLTVFETTDDDSGIRLNNVHIIAESFEQVLRISEIHFVGNAHDRAYTGTGEAGQPATVFFPLPPNAVGVAAGEGSEEGRFVEVEGGLQDTEPVPPGTDRSLVFFSYHLMVPGETVPLERTFAYPVDSLSLLVAQPGLEVRSDQLVSMGQENFQGQQYEFYAAQGLDAGTPLRIDLLPLVGAGAGSGMPAAPVESGTAATGSTTRGNQSILLWLGLGLTALVVVGAVVYPLTTKGVARTGSHAATLPSSPETRRLVAELADLEDSFEAGEVDEEAYQRRRADLFERFKAP